MWLLQVGCDPVRVLIYVQVKGGGVGGGWWGGEREELEHNQEQWMTEGAAAVDRADRAAAAEAAVPEV